MTSEDDRYEALTLYTVRPTTGDNSGGADQQALYRELLKRGMSNVLVADDGQEHLLPYPVLTKVYRGGSLRYRRYHAAMIAEAAVRKCNLPVEVLVLVVENPSIGVGEMQTLLPGVRSVPQEPE